MTLPPNRIEAAARAMFEARMAFWGLPECSWDRVGAKNKGKWLAMAESVLAQVYPELANGTAWLAPTAATGGMQAAGRDYVGQWLPEGRVAKPVTDQWQIARETWSAMRDAFLQEPKDNGG